MSGLIFIIVLSILIVVHEFGHFVTAKSLGVRVERFAVGFGPKLFSRTLFDTEFMVCLIPLGGYVKMAGDERHECKGKSDEFYSHPPGHRFLIVLFGPVVNYLFAYLCFVLVFLTGYPALSPKVGELIDGYPAQAAGLKSDDTIERIDEKEIQSFEDMLKYISTSKEGALDFIILRDGQKIRKTIEPRVEILENIFGQKEKIRIVGIRSTDETVFLKYGLLQSITKSFNRIYEITFAMYKALYRIATGAMSARDSLTGPVGIYKIIKDAASLGLSYLTLITAVISASLAVFNLLPFPVLDGGHLFLLAIEKLRRKSLSPKVDEIINRIGWSLIICLAIFIFYNDFARLGWIDKITGLWKGLGF